MDLAFIPSPSQGVWHLGPFPVRAYALCIILGVIVCVWVSERRWVARGGMPGTVTDVAAVAVPFGLVGGRLYHVITSPQLYFGAGGDPVRAFFIWEGGLGIWGAVALGALGAWLATRRRGVSFRAFGDMLAPGLILAQAIGRWGNYFNQELYGGPTTLPWGLRIDPAHRPAATPDVAIYQPTFLYESLWDAGVFVFLLWADRRWRLGGGRVFALYVAAYCVGRGWIEHLRIDPANHFFGIRLNDYTSALLLLAAVVYLVITRHRSRERVVQVDPDTGMPYRVVDEDGQLRPGTAVDVTGADTVEEVDPDGTDPDGTDPDDTVTAGQSSSPTPAVEAVEATPSGRTSEHRPEAP